MTLDSNEISEIFEPVLDDNYGRKFRELVRKINDAFPNYKNFVVKNEINSMALNYDDFEQIKYLSSLHVLYDLTRQGWSLEVQNDKLYLKMLSTKSNEKSHIRHRLDSERRAQFCSDSVIKFIDRMEKKKSYNGKQISIKNLIGDKNELIKTIQNGTRIVEPYIQRITRCLDPHTGYRDSNIWRYFRYTWSIPYKTMPGRNLYYLVRDASQEYHPIIGIFALGNSVLNLKVRDNEIGWTVDAIKDKLERKAFKEVSARQVSKTNGQSVTSRKTTFLESEKEYDERIRGYSEKTINILLKSLKDAINEIYVKDLGYHRGTKYPSEEVINNLKQYAEELRGKSIDNKKTTKVKDWENETKEILFKKKRASELSKLLDSVSCFNSFKSKGYTDWLVGMIKSERGRKAINTALVANRKTKIGSNMMEIIVCGAIPPYNDLLGGKLVSILACSPIVIRDYTEKYVNQVSEIASRMKGEKVVRDSRLAFLGTTSLYSLGSSQYNRIKVPMENGFTLEFKNIGITEGYGTVYFSKETTDTMRRILEIQDGGRRINNIFGEGTSPRFRLISRGLSILGVKADAFLQHYSPRIVYSIELAPNTNDFLIGATDQLDYPFDIDNNEDIDQKTKNLIEFWYKRWLLMRLKSVDIIQRLDNFNPNDILLSRTR